ncbi:hypothetical protein ACFUTX_04555 [Microbacterium sp. NPDC057407]|uniref:hypothetical protein n=1 Tax=Microbacterium sp. NPDC057407 TaxID=3346120 RepID=UPI00366D81DE
MTFDDSHLHVALDPDRAETIERVVADVEDDIRHGRVSDDVSRILEERLAAAGVALQPDAVEALAEALENDVSQ